MLLLRVQVICFHVLIKARGKAERGKKLSNNSVYLIRKCSPNDLTDGACLGRGTYLRVARPCSAPRPHCGWKIGGGSKAEGCKNLRKLNQHDITFIALSSANVKPM